VDRKQAYSTERKNFQPVRSRNSSATASARAARRRFCDDPHAPDFGMRGASTLPYREFRGRQHQFEFRAVEIDGLNRGRFTTSAYAVELAAVPEWKSPVCVFAA
jgi:hypothetical protein